MPRVQLYLPDDLYEALKKHELPASRLLQDAVRRELGRREAIEEALRYAAAIVDHFGEPSAEDYEWAERLSQDVRRAGERSFDPYHEVEDRTVSRTGRSAGVDLDL